MAASCCKGATKRSCGHPSEFPLNYIHNYNLLLIGLQSSLWGIISLKGALLQMLLLLIALDVLVIARGSYCWYSLLWKISV